MFVLEAGGGHSQPVSTCTLPSVIPSGHVFADTQDASKYKEFMNADKEMSSKLDFLSVSRFFNGFICI